jgi:predicted KAP-like P-loop ATPase
MFVRCSKCDWSQDDFWTKSYDSISSQYEFWSEKVKDAIDEKNPKRIIETDRSIAMERGMPFNVDKKGNALVDVRDFVSKEMENIARRVRHMHWITQKDFDEDINKTCPVCGSSIIVD